MKAGGTGIRRSTPYLLSILDFPEKSRNSEHPSRIPEIKENRQSSCHTIFVDVVIRGAGSVASISQGLQVHARVPASNP